MKRRLLIITAEYPYGTAESFLEDEIDALASSGTDVYVLPTRPTGQIRDSFPKSCSVISVRLLTLMSLLRFLAWSVRHPRVLIRITRRLLRDGPHLVKNLAVLPKAIDSVRAMREWPLAHIHAHWLSTSATLAMIMAELLNVPFSVSAHRWDIVDGNLARLKVERATFVRTISGKGKQMLDAKLAGTVGGNVVVVHLGVSDVRQGTESLAQPAGSNGMLRMVCPANLIPVKGHDVLIDAIGILRSRNVNTTLDIFGSGGLESSIRAKVLESGLSDRVHLRGQVERDTLLARYRDGMYDVIVLPSRDLGNGVHEGVPASLMEAMVMGIAAVATETGSIPELIEDGEGGLLVPGGDAAALAAALERLWRDPALGVSLGLGGREKVLRDFSARQSASDLRVLMNL